MSHYNQTRCALRFFYRVTLGRDGSPASMSPGQAAPHPPGRPQPRRGGPLLRGHHQPQAPRHPHDRLRRRACGSPRSPASASPTSTASAWSSASARARGRRTATSCSRRGCLQILRQYWKAARPPRLSLPRTRARSADHPGRRSARSACRARDKRRAWTSTSPSTPCGTASPPTCSRPAPTCGPSRSCWAIAASAPRRGTSTWPPRPCASTRSPLDRLDLASRRRSPAMTSTSAQRGRGHPELSRRVPGKVRRQADARATPRAERPGRLPHRGPGRSRPGVPRVRASADRLQLLRQPPLPHLPGHGRGAVAGGAAPPSCSPCRTSTSSSRSRMPSTRSHWPIRRVVYDLLLRSAAETLLEVAADPEHLGAQTGVLAVLHTWGQNLQFHPHVHCVVPGGGLSPDGTRWIGSRPDFFLPVRVLSRVFRGKFLAGLRAALAEGRLRFAADSPLRGGSTAARRPSAPTGWSMPNRRSGVLHDTHLKYPRETQEFAGPDGVMTDGSSETVSRRSGCGTPPRPRRGASTAHRDTPAVQAIADAGSCVAPSSSSRRAGSAASSKVSSPRASRSPGE